MKCALIGIIILSLLCGVTAFAEAVPGTRLVRVNDSLKGGTTASALAKVVGFTPADVIEADTLTEALAVLKSGQADALYTYGPTAKFVVGMDDTLAAQPLKGEITFRLLSLSKKAEFIEQADFIINELKTEETNEKFDKRLYEIIKQYITALKPGQLPKNKRVYVMPDAKTLRVGISGDFPPVDYIDPDGVPRGFDDAFLIMIAGGQNLNIEYVLTPYKDRYDAVKSGKVDVFFFEPVGVGYADVTKNGYLLSQPFITTTPALVVVKK